MSYQGKKNIPKITVSKEGIIHASLAAGTSTPSVANHCMSVFTVVSLRDGYLRGPQHDSIFSPLLSRLTAGSYWGRRSL